MFCWHIVHSCQQYCPKLLHLIYAQQYCSILLRTMKNLGSQILFSPDLIDRVSNYEATNLNLATAKPNLPV